MRRYLIFMILMLLFLFNLSPAYINIYPYRVYLDIQRNLMEAEIVLYNKTDRVVRYKISIDDRRLKNQISFYPQVITLKSGEEKNVKLKLEKGWEELENREYYSNIFVEQLRVPLRDSKGNFIQSQGVEVYPKIKIPLKIYSGSEKIAILKRDEREIENISGREINLELFYNRKINSKENLDFIKNLRLSKGEILNLENIFQGYQKKKEIDREITLREIVILDKLSGDKLELSER